MPLLTVIVPHKNSSRKLERLLRTIPEEPWLEVIVVDDGSRASENVEEVALRHEQVIFLQNNRQPGNAGTARNKGIEHSKGTWLMFSDADDIFIDYAFKTIREVLKSNEDKDCIYFKVRSFTSDSAREGDRHVHYNCLINGYVRSGDDAGLRFNWPAPWGRLIKRELVVGNKLAFSNRIAANDVVFAVKLGALAGSISVINDALYSVEKSSTSLTSSLTAEKAFARLQSLIERNNLLVENRHPEMVHFGFRYFVKSLPIILDRPHRNVLRSYLVSIPKVYPHAIYSKAKSLMETLRHKFNGSKG